MGRAYSTRPSQILNLPSGSFDAIGVDAVCYMAGLSERAQAEAGIIDEWRAATGGKGSLVPPIVLVRDTRVI